MDISAINSQIERKIEPLIVKLARPLNLSRFAIKFPQSLNKTLTAKVLNIAFAEQISEGDFDFLDNRIFQVEIIDAKLFIAMSFKSKKIICCHFNCFSIESDVYLSVNSLNAVRLIQQEIDPDTLFFQRKLKIRGDTELAHHVKNTIDTLNPERIPAFMMKIISEYKQRILKS